MRRGFDNPSGNNVDNVSKLDTHTVGWYNNPLRSHFWITLRNVQSGLLVVNIAYLTRSM